jgi:2-polyprenyl-6-hydroxyphenyl methylase/3-demethylubiquinone-9 3-methyltransferase
MSEIETGKMPGAHQGRATAGRAFAPSAAAARSSAIAAAAVEPLELAVGGDMGVALAAYASQPLRTRLFVRVRHLLCPMLTVAREVPMSGRILDIGCGHGLFCALLASGSPLRRVVGVDPSVTKIASARASARASATFAPSISYIHGSALDVNDGPYDAITILDVLYLLPDDLVRPILAQARKLIADDGIFLLKTNDKRPLWKYAVVRAEEWVMVKLLHYTLGRGLHFRSSEQYLRMLEEAGFVAAVHKIDGWRPAPHRLFVCRPK